MSDTDPAIPSASGEPGETAASDKIGLVDIVIKGARTHNLKNIDLTLPVGKLAIITGVSGSGKSSLAFDTVYAEGQRRYVESLSAYARQFLERMEKPDVDDISGIAPAVAIRQKKFDAESTFHRCDCHRNLRLLTIALRPLRRNLLHQVRRVGPPRQSR